MAAANLASPAVGDPVTASQADLIATDVNLVLNSLIFNGVQSATQSFGTSGTTAALSFDTHTVDTYSGHSDSTNNTRYTIPAALNGFRLRFEAVVLYVPNATGGRVALMRKNGLTVPLDGQTAVGTAGTSFGTSVPLSYSAVVVTGDYWEVMGGQSSGGALSSSTGSRLAIYFEGLT